MPFLAHFSLPVTTTGSTATNTSKNTKTSSKTSSKTTTSSAVTDNIIVNSLNATKLDAIKKETNLKRWDIAWAPTPTTEFFDFDNNVSPSTPIWKGVKNEKSVFEDADWGLLMHAIKDTDNDTPALYIYNKCDIPNGVKSFEVIARSNPLSSLLSGRGAFRVRVAYKINGKYTVENLKIVFTDNQIAQKEAQFKQGANGYVTFEVPPKSDKSDAFEFDVTKLVGKTDVVFFVEVNDRMDKLGAGDTNLPDRVIVAAMRFKS